MNRAYTDAGGTGEWQRGREEEWSIERERVRVGVRILAGRVRVREAAGTEEACAEPLSERMSSGRVRDSPVRYSMREPGKAWVRISSGRRRRARARSYMATSTR